MVIDHNDISQIEDDEISLYDIFLVLKRRAILILSIFLITLLAAGTISFVMTPVYRSSFIIKGPVTSYSNYPQAFVISPEESGKLIKALDKAVADKRITELSNFLKISANNANKIVSFEAILPVDDTKNYIETVINIEDPTLIVSIKDGIMGYLNQNKYVSERINLTRKSLMRRKKAMQAKINEIDDFKNILTEQIKSGKRNNLGFNPMLMESDVMNLRQELNDIEDRIQLLKGFEVVVEPFIPTNPVKPKKILNMAVAGIISLFLGVLIAFFMESLDKSRKRVNKTIT
jgi:capsular polysaccharide biosynthesis protein